MSNNHLIIDGHALAFRSHFAFVDLMTSTGLYSGALYGFLTSLATLKKKYRDFKVTVAWDNACDRKKTIYAEYKANRSSYNLSTQVNDLKATLRCLDVLQAECQGEEADDVIATLVAHYKTEGKIYIYSSDKDLFQLVEDGKVIILSSAKSQNTEFYDEEGVYNKFGVKPVDIACYFALRGDTIDGVPGLPRVKSSTICRLIEKYRTIPAIYDNLPNEKLTDFERKTFAEFVGQAKINYQLTQLVPTLMLLEYPGSNDPQRLQICLDKYEIKKIRSDLYVTLFGSESQFKARTGPVYEMTSLFD